MIVLIVVAAVVVVLAVIGFGTYNRMVRLRNTIHESWRDIDAELQRRHDLVPNLVATVKGYAAHERAVFDDVTNLRAAAMAAPRTPEAQGPPEAALGQGLSRLVAVSENYPDLKASTQFLDLQHQLTDTEDRIQVARRIYNANVRSYNTLVESFPSLLVARAAHFVPAVSFQIDRSALVLPQVDM
jgi:LemA protein